MNAHINLDSLDMKSGMDWQIQHAKNRLSEVLQKAQGEGPQFVTQRGKRTAVVLSVADYEALRRDAHSLVDDMLGGPAWDDELVQSINERSKSPSRDNLF